jgi:hypothetical protein
LRVYYGLDFFPLASWQAEVSGTIKQTLIASV